LLENFWANCRIEAQINGVDSSNTERPLPSTTMASQSMKQDCTGRLLTAATIRGNVATCQDAKAVVLDLVDPVRTGRRLFRQLRQTGLDGSIRE
jgi:hypothetical protein